VDQRPCGLRLPAGILDQHPQRSGQRKLGRDADVPADVRDLCPDGVADRRGAGKHR
jgi:hypothetical protein